MAPKTKLRSSKLSIRHRSTLEGEVETHKLWIDKTVYALYGVSEPPTR